MTQRLAEQTLQLVVEKRPHQRGRNDRDVVGSKKLTGAIHGAEGALGMERGEKQTITLERLFHEGMFP